MIVFFASDHNRQLKQEKISKSMEFLALSMISDSSLMCRSVLGSFSIIPFPTSLRKQAWEKYELIYAEVYAPVARWFLVLN